MPFLGLRTDRTVCITLNGGSVQGHQVGDEVSTKGWNAFARVTNEVSGFERIGVSVQGTALGAKSVELRVGSDVALDSVSFPAATARTTGVWSRDAMFPSGGSFVLNAAANHPSGAFTARTNAAFSLAARHFGVVDDYDEEGQTTKRTIAGGAIASGRTQYLTWDGAGRLVRVVQDEFGGSGFEWSAVYDGFNRRIQTLYTPKINGVLTAAQQVRERSWYDPRVEFLEVAIEVFKATSNTTERWWSRSRWGAAETDSR